MRAVPRAAAVETAKAKAPDSDIQAAERLKEMLEDKGPLYAVKVLPVSVQVQAMASVKEGLHL